MFIKAEVFANIKKYGILFFLTFVNVLFLLSCTTPAERVNSDNIDEDVFLSKDIPEHTDNITVNTQKPEFPESVVEIAQNNQSKSESEVVNSMSSIASVDKQEDGNITITLPPEFFSEADEFFDYEKYAREQSFLSAEPDENKNVTVEITPDRHKKLLKSIKTEIQSNIEEMIKSNATPYILNVDFSDNFNVINIFVEKEEFEKVTVDTAPFTLAASAMIYQTYAGADKFVKVNIIDEKTDLTIESIVYPQ